MERLNYTVILLTTKRVKRVMPDYWFDSREQAERFAEGLQIGADLATDSRKHAVILLPDGEFKKDCITKNMDNKHNEVFLRSYLWPKQEQANELVTI